MILTKQERLSKRHLRVRKRVTGSTERPRLVVRKSLKNFYACVVDDSPLAGSRTLASYTTATKDNVGKHNGNISSAEALGKKIGEDLKGRGIGSIVFDRGGYRYHGCVKAIADGIRAAGIEF